MSVLDELLPVISTDSLAALLAQPESERLVEGLFFEFKSEWVPRHVAKSVAAFANSSGGFILFGASAVAGRLESFPGLLAEVEFPERVANNVIGQVSPLPDWTVTTVECPGAPGRVVVVVKVRESRRTPHVHCKTGYVYQRSPGGTSEPIKDRATLDRIIEKGLVGEQLVADRLKSVAAQLAIPEVGWQFSVVSTPLPYRSVYLPALLTQQGYRDAPRYFRGQLLIAANTEGVEENAVLLRFSSASFARLFQDGTAQVWWDYEHELIPVETLGQLVTDLLRAQRSFQPPVHESRLLIGLRQTEGRRLALTFEQAFGRTSRHPIPDPWFYESETSTLEAGIRWSVDTFKKRLWRSTGTLDFDDVLLAPAHVQRV